ncbi:MAG: hypothetical protein QW821_02740 [Candidatus Bathyarchaeia archaeon]
MRVKWLFSLVLLFAAGLLSPLSVKASPETVIWVSPQLNFCNVGETFVIDIKLTDVERLYWWGVEVRYNASILDFVYIEYPPGFIFNGHNWVPISAWVEPGAVFNSVSLVGDDSVSGSGGLMRITLVCIAPGGSMITINLQSFLLNPEMQFIPFTTSDGYFHSYPVGDITGPEGVPDGKVDMRDIGTVARHFGELVEPGDPKDVFPDGKIDMKDIGIVAKNFGRHS